MRVVTRHSHAPLSGAIDALAAEGHYRGLSHVRGFEETGRAMLTRSKSGKEPAGFTHGVNIAPFRRSTGIGSLWSQMKGTRTPPPSRTRPQALVALRALVKSARGGRPSTEEFVRRIEAGAAFVLPNLREAGGMQGLAFVLDGHRFAASALGSQYSWPRLSEDLVLDPSADVEGLRRAEERAVQTLPELGPRRLRNRSGGRPAKPPVKLRTNRTVRFSDEEWASVQDRAARSGETPANYIRRVALSRPLRAAVPVVNNDAIGELGRVGNNLNQIARALNSGRSAPGLLEHLETLRLLLLERLFQAGEPA